MKDDSDIKCKINLEQRQKKTSIPPTIVVQAF